MFHNVLSDSCVSVRACFGACACVCMRACWRVRLFGVLSVSLSLSRSLLLSPSRSCTRSLCAALCLCLGRGLCRCNDADSSTRHHLAVLAFRYVNARAACCCLDLHPRSSVPVRACIRALARGVVIRACYLCGRCRGSMAVRFMIHAVHDTPKTAPPWKETRRAKDKERKD